MKKRAIALLAVIAAGCHSNGPQAISPRAFNAPTQALTPPPLPKEEHPLAIVAKPPPLYTQLTVPAPKMPGAVQHTPTTTESTADPVVQAIRDQVQSPDVAVTRGLPTAQPGESLGMYMTVGGVVAVVNGVPIYADKVMRALAPVLAAEAHDLGRHQYEQAAYQLIVKQIHEYENAELEFADADKTLGDDDKKLARSLTVAWRAKLITDSGGSIELARQKVEADGKNFDEVVTEQYRVFLNQLYYEKRIYPRITISATDMRRYYDDNVKADFTEYDEAQFRLIRIDPGELGGNDQALSRAKDVHDRAVRGEDFANLAETYNKAGSMLSRKKGDVGMMQRGSYTLEEVEKAVWTCQPGQVTDLVKEKDGCFYIAKMEVRKNGVVHPFEDEAVQRHIRLAISSSRLLSLRMENRAKLLKEAVINDIDAGGDPHMIDSAMDMAMQRYAVWAKKS